MSENESLSLERLRSQIAEQEKCVDFFRERKLKRQRLSTIIKKFFACSAFDFMHCEYEIENKNDSNELTHETQTNKSSIEEDFVKYDNFVQVQRKQANRESNEEHLENLCDDDNEHKLNEVECESNAKATKENDNKLEIKEITSEIKQEQLEQTSKEEEEEQEKEDEDVDVELMELQELMQELIEDGDELQKMISKVNFHDEESKQIAASEQEEITNKDSLNDASNKKDVKDEDEDFDAEITMDELIDGHEANNKTNSVIDDRTDNTNAESNAVDNSCTPECIEPIEECSTISLVITNNVNAETNTTTKKNNEVNEKQHAALMLALESFTLIQQTGDTIINNTNTIPLWLDDENTDDDNDTKANKIEDTDLKSKYTCTDDNTQRSKIGVSNKEKEISDSVNNKGSEELSEDEVYEDDFENDEIDDASRDDAVDVYTNHETEPNHA